MNNETMDNETMSLITVSEAFKISYCVITALVIIIGVIGNSLVIYVVVRFSSMQTIANIHLMNLSIADLVFLISGFIFLSNVIQKSFIFGLIGCKIYLIMTGVNSFTSTYSMTLMSIDRYLAVCHPISSKSIRNPRMTKWIILGLWLFSFVLMMPLMIYGNLVSWSNENEHSINNGSMTLLNMSLDIKQINQYACVINWNISGKLTSHGFTLYNFGFGFLCPVVIICILYPLVIIRLHNVGPRNKSQERRDLNRRITRLVLAIVALYIILWLPYWVLQLFTIFHDQEYSASARMLIMYLNLTMLCLNYINSAINPILYAFMSPNFRSSFQLLIICYQSRPYMISGTISQIPQETIQSACHKTLKIKNHQNIILNQPLITKAADSQRCTELIVN